MRHATRLWAPALTAVLIAMAIGPAGNAATVTEGRVTTTSVMISASDFIPTSDNWDYVNYGSWVALQNGSGNFTKGLDFPAGVVSIKRITLYAVDDDPAADVCVTLLRTRPVEASEDYAGEVCTTDASAPQSPYTTDLNPRRVATAFQHAYLQVTLSGTTVQFIGVKVTYSY